MEAVENRLTGAVSPEATAAHPTSETLRGAGRQQVAARSKQAMTAVVDDPRVGSVHIGRPVVFRDRAFELVTVVDLEPGRCAGCAQPLMGKQSVGAKGIFPALPRDRFV
jgi:hypothetical protein